MNNSAEWINRFFEWLWMTSTRATLLIAVVILLQGALRCWLKPQARHWLNLLVLLGLLLPIAPPSRISVENLWRIHPRETPLAPAPPPVNLPHPEAIDSTLALNPGPGVDLSPSWSPIWSPVNLAKIIWLAGGLGLLALAAIRYRAWGKTLQRAHLVEDPEILELLRSAQQDMGVKRSVEVRAIKGLSSPAIFGLWQVRLLLPKHVLVELSRDQLRWIFLHELAHVRHHDLALNWVQMAAQFLHWFNPLVWLAMYRLRADRELVRDALVLHGASEAERQSYGQVLLRLAEKAVVNEARLPVAIPVIGSKKEIARRIMAIKDRTQSSLMTRLGAVALITILAAVTLTRAKERAETTPSVAQGTVPATDPSTLTVTITADGSLLLGSAKTKVSLEQLASELAIQKVTHPNLEIAIRPANNAPVGSLVKVWDLVKQVGIAKINVPVNESGPGNEERVARAATEMPPTVSPARQAEARVFYEKAMKHYMANEYEEQLEQLDKALELDPNHTEALFSRGCLYGGGLPEGDRDYAKAVADYTRLLTIEPRNCSARHNRALCYEQLRQPDEALADYTRIIEGDTDFSRIGDGRDKQVARSSLYRGRVYHFSKHDYAKAAADYSNALKLDLEMGKNDDSRIVLRRGQAYQASKQYANAQDDYTWYTKISPDYFELWFSWAWQLATASDPKFRNGARAVEYARKAGPNPEILAAAYAENGDFAKAIELQEQALANIEDGRKPPSTWLAIHGLGDDSKAAVEKRLALYRAGRAFHQE